MINRINPFYLNDSPYYPGKCIISVHHEQFHCTSTLGSYNLLPARLLNISYANFLRLARDEYDAELVGKNTWYPIAYFPHNDKTMKLVRILNALATLVEFQREHPDFEEHKEYVEEYEQSRDSWRNN